MKHILLFKIEIMFDYVGIKVDVATRVDKGQLPVVQMTAIGANNVNKLGICRVQSVFRVVEEVKRSGGIKAGDLTDSTGR